MDFSNLPFYYWILIIGGIIACNIPFFRTMAAVSRNKNARKLTKSEQSDMRSLLLLVQEDKTLIKLKSYLDELMEGKLDLIPVYGYKMKNTGLVTKTVYNYMYGFNPSMEGFVLVEIDTKGHPIGQPYHLDCSNMSSIKYMLDGSLQIKSSLFEGGSLAVVIPGFTTDDHIDLYMLKVNQVATTTAFKTYIKQTFNL